MTATLFAVPAFAADAPAEGVKPSPVPDQKFLPAREEIIKRFDQDGDGQLSDTERQAARKEMKGKWAKQGGPMREKMMKRFDRNGDVQLDEARRADAQAHRQEVLSRFDADGDGKLGDTERQAMREAWKKFLSQQPSLKPTAG